MGLSFVSAQTVNTMIYLSLAVFAVGRVYAGSAVDRSISHEVSEEQGQRLLGVDGIASRKGLWANKADRTTPTDLCASVVLPDSSRRDTEGSSGNAPMRQSEVRQSGPPTDWNIERQPARYEIEGPLAGWRKEPFRDSQRIGHQSYSDAVQRWRSAPVAYSRNVWNSADGSQSHTSQDSLVTR